MKTSKICICCNIEKQLHEFPHRKISKDGRRNNCHDCKNIYLKSYRKTKYGLIQKIFNDQFKNKSKTPNYTINKFYKWVINQDLFHTIYENWVNSEYKKDLVPSIDRINDYLPYSIENIQILNWYNNREKYYNDVKNGINNKRSKRVLQCNLNGEIIFIHNSIQIASKNTNINASGISKCCNGKIEKIRGYIFKF